MLPEKFCERMRLLLGDEYEAFEEALSLPSVRAVRLNPLKDPEARFLRDGGYTLRPLPYTDCGYIVDSGDGIGNSLYHHAGAFYVQDPGAMISAEAADIGEGMWVADLCAAPGGKSTQAAAKIGTGGFLLSNEYVPKRAKILVGNIERLGIKNAVVTSLDTSELAKLYSSVFDVVIVDAPCSGEGMFRKGDTAREEWSEENVLSSAKRQAYILDNASGLVRSGGCIIYSTCTYSLEENEMTVDAFLRRHPEFMLVPATERVQRASTGGICFAGAFEKDLSYTRRFYPHISEGEGQFVAVMRRRDGADTPQFRFKDALAEPKRDELRIIEKFFSDNLISRPEGRIKLYNRNLVLVSHDLPVPPSSVFSAGVLIGEIRGENLFPSHQFVSAYGSLYKRKEELKSEAEAVKYLSGEELEAHELKDKNGFCAVTYRGALLGGGKASSGRIKNHCPKGLRLK